MTQSILIFSILLTTLLLKDHKKVLFIVALVILTFFSGFRIDIGEDYKNYIIFISESKYGYFESATPYNEFGYSLLVSIINIFKLNHFWFFLITAFITWFNFLYFFKFFNFLILGIFFVLFFGIYFDSFNLVRQYLALSFFFSAIVSYKKVKYKNVWFKILLAVSFHSMSIILIPSFFLLNFVKLKPRNLVFIILSLLVILGLTSNSLSTLISAYEILAIHDFSESFEIDAVSGLFTIFFIIYYFLQILWLALKKQDLNQLQYFFLLQSSCLLIISFFSFTFIPFIRFIGFFAPFLFFSPLIVINKSYPFKYFLTSISFFFYIYFLFKNQIYLDYKFIFN